MTVVEDVLKIILQFYPRKMKFDEYRRTPEFQKLLNIRKKNMDDTTYGTRLLDILRTTFCVYSIVDWTDLQNSNCYEYKILLSKDQPILDDDIQLIKVLGGRRTDLRLFVSILGKYYYSFVEETCYDENSGKWNFYTYNHVSSEVENEIGSLREKLNLERYTELFYDLIDTVIPEIETEYVGSSEVKVFHCLFTDLVTP